MTSEQREPGEWFRVTLSCIGDAVITTDHAGRVTFLNSIAEKLTGWTPTEAKGQPLETVFHIVNEYTREPAENPVARVLREGTIVGLANHTALIARDGTVRPIADSAAPIKEGEGAVVGVVLIFRDVSAERHAEEGRRRLAAIVEWSDDAILSKTLEGIITSWNKGAERLYGYTAEEIIGQHVSVLVPPERLDELAVIMSKIRQGEVADHFETIRRRKDGTLLDVSVTVSPVADAAGQLIGASTIARSITESKRAERDLRDSEERKSAILNTALDCIITIDHQGKIVEFNPAAERTFGYRRDDVLGHDLAAVIVPPALRDRHYQGLAHYLSTGEGPVLGQRIEMPALRADGTEIPVELAITAVRLQGRPVFTAYLRELTESKRAEGRRAARLAVSQIFSESPALSTAVLRLLQTLCEALGWDVGAFWQVDVATQLLRCGGVWNAPTAGVTEFEAATRERTFARGVGLPGRIWASSQPSWVPDVVQDGNFPRAAIADRVGLHGAFGFPVLVGHEFLGVIEFFSRKIQEPDADLLEMMGTVGGQIGQFIERLRAEAARRESEERFRVLADSSPVLIWVNGLHGCEFVNRAYLDYLGATPADVRDFDWAQFIHPEDRDSYLNTYHAAFTERISYTAQCRLRRADGEYRWMKTAAAPRLGENGRFQGYVGSTFDITDIKLAEQTLRESEERLRLALDAGRMGTWEWNIRLNSVAWSPGLEALHGLAPGGFSGTFEAFLRDMHPEDRERVLESLRSTLEDGKEHRVEYRIIWPDGSQHWVEGRGNLFRDEHGNPIRMIGVCTDIDQRKAAENKTQFLADASETLASLVDYESTLQKVVRLAVPFFADWCVVDMLDDDGKLRRLSVAHVDPAKVELARDMWRRFPPDPDAPQGVWNILRTGDSEIVAEVTDELLESTVKEPEVLRLLRELGLRSYIGVPLSVRGKVLGVLTFITAESGRRYNTDDLAVAEDLAHRAAVAVENARLYQALREADRRKDEFLALLGHELRNPLAPISNALHVLKLPQANEAMRGQAREMLERQVEHMVRLVDDLLDVSRIMRGKVELRQEAIDLATVVARAVETAQPVIDAEGHRLVVAPPAEPLWVHGDLLRLAQVVANLLHNAAKYTESGGTIALATARENDEAVVRVRDNGIGLAPEALSQIFEMFFQADRRTKDAHGGLGIGLSLVRGLVESHGGSVEAHSAGLGSGSEFVVRLPLLPRKRPDEYGPPEKPSDNADQFLSRPVLVVDDNVDAADSLAMLLRLLKQNVVVAYDGAAALAQAEANPPAVAFVDLGMPLMDGFELARRFREHPALMEVFLVAVTGWGQPEDRQRTKENGFDHHIVKPVDADALRRLLCERLISAP